MTTAVREAPTIAAALQRTREATLRLLEPLDDEVLVAQVSPIMSPLVWDLAHIGWFEELWLVRRGAESEPSLAGFDDLYDAFRHERAERSGLPILKPAEARAYLETVRRQTLTRARVGRAAHRATCTASSCSTSSSTRRRCSRRCSSPALRTRRRLTTTCSRRPRPRTCSSRPARSRSVRTDQSWAYDNERPAHVVELPAFRIERHPVTNERFTEFVEDGGYRERRYWSDDGWRWLLAERAEAPLYWERAREGWLRRRFGHREPVPPAEPVQHISFHEAEAVAAWAGKRLPTEAEWEKAAQGAEPGADANLGRASFGPRPVARRATSSVGCDCMVGDVWEWTSSTFAGYPGFEAFPYAEYSEVFFGDEHRVLRGGSWATDPLVARVTFRNWDLPQRRQLFSGVRLASDA